MRCVSRFLCEQWFSGSMVTGFDEALQPTEIEVEWNDQWNL
jgi:hypothetical protein